MAQVKLKRLKIDKYRNVAPGTELVFNDTVNVLLGKNGTGKTTLLKLIAMVVASDFEPLKDTEFSFEYELAYHGVGVTVTIENRPGESALERIRKAARSLVAPNLSSQLPAWSYRVEIRLTGYSVAYSLAASPQGAEQQMSNQPSMSLSASPNPPFEVGFLLDAIFGAKDLFREQGAESLSEVIDSYTTIYLNNGRFDEALGGFGALTNISTKTRLDDLAASQIKFAVTRKDGLVPHLNVFSPVRMLFDLSDLILQSPGIESIVVLHTKLDFMKKAVELFGFVGGEMILRLTKKDVTGDSEAFTYSNFSFLFTLDQGSVITQEALSYGQKRLLSFLYYVAANDDIIIADELVNGMHYEWIEACLDELGDRQSFLTSQNPLLLDFLPFASAEEVQKSFIQCSREKREDGRAQLHWTNLSQENAESFYRAYEAGVQHVGEILRTKGLW